MNPLSDIAKLNLRMADIENTIKTYQRIVDLKDKFKFIRDNDLGKAYLFINNYDKAIEHLEDFEVNGHDYSNGLFIAFAYLKKGDKKKFIQKFDKWISEDLEKSFDYDKYSNMEPYKLYCELYKQCYPKSKVDKEEIDDDSDNEDFEIPAKLSKHQFEQLRAEYLYLERKTMFGDPDDADYDKLFKLQDILFADITIG